MSAGVSTGTCFRAPRAATPTIGGQGKEGRPRQSSSPRPPFPSAPGSRNAPIRVQAARSRRDPPTHLLGREAAAALSERLGEGQDFVCSEPPNRPGPTAASARDRQRRNLSEVRHRSGLKCGSCAGGTARFHPVQVAGTETRGRCGFSNFGVSARWSRDFFVEAANDSRTHACTSARGPRTCRGSILLKMIGGGVRIRCWHKRGSPLRTRDRPGRRLRGSSPRIESGLLARPRRDGGPPPGPMASARQAPRSRRCTADGQKPRRSRRSGPFRAGDMGQDSRKNRSALSLLTHESNRGHRERAMLERGTIPRTWR